jgi:hypothetical protein
LVDSGGLLVYLFIPVPAETSPIPNVDRADNRDSLEAMVTLGGANCVTPTGANANKEDAIDVDVVESLQVVGHGRCISDSRCRVL